MKKKPIKKNYAFVDNANVTVSVARQGWHIDRWKLKWRLERRWNVGKVFMLMGYHPDYEPMYEYFRSLGYDLVFKPMNIWENIELKGNIDTDLVLRVMKEWTKYDKAILLTWDGDFMSLVTHLKAKKKLGQIIVPHSGRYSHFLDQAAGEYITSLTGKKRWLEYIKGSKRKKDDKKDKGEKQETKSDGTNQTPKKQKQIKSLKNDTNPWVEKKKKVGKNEKPQKPKTQQQSKKPQKTKITTQPKKESQKKDPKVVTNVGTTNQKVSKDVGKRNQNDKKIQSKPRSVWSNQRQKTTNNNTKKLQKPEKQKQIESNNDIWAKKQQQALKISDLHKQKAPQKWPVPQKKKVVTQSKSNPQQKTSQNKKSEVKGTVKKRPVELQKRSSDSKPIQGTRTTQPKSTQVPKTTQTLKKTQKITQPASNTHPKKVLQKKKLMQPIQKKTFSKNTPQKKEWISFIKSEPTKIVAPKGVPASKRPQKKKNTSQRHVSPPRSTENTTTKKTKEIDPSFHTRFFD